jgi:hypothetical protein
MGISSAPGLEMAEQRGKADQRKPTDQKLMHVMSTQVVNDVRTVATAHGIAESPTAVTPFRAHLITKLMPGIVPGAMVTTATTRPFTVAFRARLRLRAVLLVDREFLSHTDSKFGHLILRCLLLGVAMMLISS